MKHYEEEILKPLKGILGKSIEKSPRWAKIVLAVLLCVFAVLTIFVIARYFWNRAVEEKLNAEMNRIRADQKVELDVLRGEAIRVGNIPKDSVTQQKKKLDTAYKALKGPQTSLLQQSAELNALRTAVGQVQNK